MRSDAKLGMALGMLVVGFAIAFCFPREGRVSIVEQVVNRQQQPDEEVVEFVPIRDLREEVSSTVPEVLTDPTLYEQEMSTDLGSQHSGSMEIVADGERPSADVSLKNLLPKPETAEPSGTAQVLSQSNLPQSTVEKTYLVQQGDTLSGISMKTLGSYGRYLDIFAANRDQLDSPDDLRLGMKLKIPALVENHQELLLSNTNEEEVLPQGIESDLEVQTEQAPNRFTNPESTPFLTDRGQKMPVHQIPSQRVKTHTVQAGDSLERIAVRYFGTVRAVRQIHLANPDLLNDPNRLKPGTVLKLVP